MLKAEDGETAWLRAAAVPGRSDLTLAAVAQALESVFAIVQWAALAWIAQGLFVRRMQPGWPQLAVLFGGGLMAALSAWSAAMFQAKARLRISRAIRQRLVAALLPSGQRRAEPDAATTALASVELTEDVADYHVQTRPQRWSGPASMAVIFLITAAVQWPAAVILLLASLIIPPNMRLAGLFAKEGSDERLTATTRLGAAVLDSFRGMRTLKTIGAVARRRGELADAAARLNATTMAVVRRAALSGTVMDVVITFSIAVDATYIGLSLLGYVHLGIAPAVTLFNGLLALLLCPMYFQPLRAMGAAYHSKERAVSAARVIAPLLAEAEPAPQVTPVVALSVAGPVALVLDRVTFRFPRSNRQVVNAQTMTIDRGRWTAVVGPSGAGKTTLLTLIAGARRPTAGSVRWVTPTGVLSPTLGRCAWIGQQTVLIPGSIAENIRVGRPGASQGQVERAVAAAGLDEVVARLPNGLDTEVGEGGAGLSTGEARRIAIARAFLSEAELWVLDEPTAHLDPDAEAQVIDALRRVTRGRTVVVATHSTAVVGSADAVLHVAGGTVYTAPEAIPA